MRVRYIKDKKENDVDIENISNLKDTISHLSKKYEIKILTHYLKKNNYNKAKTSRDLGITRKTLDLKLKALNIIGKPIG